MNKKILVSAALSGLLAGSVMAAHHDKKAEHKGKPPVHEHMGMCTEHNECKGHSKMDQKNACKGHMSKGTEMKCKEAGGEWKSG